MPQWRGSAKFKQAMKTASAEAIQAAARWLVLALKVRVGIQCGASSSFSRMVKGVRVTSRGGKGGHSRPGEYPKRETGQGQADIMMEPTADGANVGIRNIGIKNMVGGHYMAGWDYKGITHPSGYYMGRRPWLSRFISEPYTFQPEFTRIVHRLMGYKLRIAMGMMSDALSRDRPVPIETGPAKAPSGAGIFWSEMRARYPNVTLPPSGRVP